MSNEKPSSAKKVLINSGIYSITSIFQKAIGFILLPLYTLYLTPQDYGIVGVVNSLTAVLTLLFTFSLNSAVQRYYYRYRENWEQLKSFYGTIMIFILLNSCLLGGIIVLLKDILIEPFISSIAFYPYIFMGVLTVIVNPIYTIYQTLLQTMERAKTYAINSLLNFAMMVTCNILFIVIFQWGASGQLMSYLLTGLTFGVYSLVSLYQQDIIAFRFNKSYLKEALTYSVPLLPHLMSTQIADFVSRLFLNNQVSTASAGLYTTASQFMLIIDTIQYSVNSAYVPWFYSLMDMGGKEKEKAIQFTDILSRLYLLISLGMAFFIKEVIQIFIHPSYLLAWTLVPVILIAYQIRSIYLFYVNTLFYNTKATRFIFLATLSGSLLSVFLSATLTQVLGLMTPAVVLLLQWMLTTGVVYLLSRKIEPVDFKIKRLLGYVGILILGSGMGLFYDICHPEGPLMWQNFLYKVVLYLMIAFLLLHRDLPTLKTMAQNMLKHKKKGSKA